MTSTQFLVFQLLQFFCKILTTHLSIAWGLLVPELTEFRQNSLQQNFHSDCESSKKTSGSKTEATKDTTTR